MTHTAHDASIVPSFAYSTDSGVPLSPVYWFETFETELRRVYLERTAARSLQPDALNFVGWCFKRYERYTEACAEVYEEIGDISAP